MSQIDPDLQTIFLTHPPTHVVHVAPTTENPRGGHACACSQPLSSLPWGTGLEQNQRLLRVAPEEREEVGKPSWFISKPWPQLS